MPDFYQLTVQYADDREVKTVHKGLAVHPRIVARFKTLGMSAEVGARLPEEAQTYWRRLDETLFAATALGWNPHMTEEEADDA